MRRLRQLSTSPPKSSTKTLDTSLFVAILSFPVTGIIALLQWNGVVTVHWALSLVGYVALSSLSLWSFWRWEFVHNLDMVVRFLFSVVLGMLLVVVSTLGVASQYRREHPRSVLSATALNANFVPGEKFKIEKHSDVRVVIDNRAEPLIQNLDLTVQADKSFIFDIEQLSGITGVEFHASDTRLDHVGFWLKGAESKTYYSLRDLLSMGGRSFPVQQWKVFCPRLAGKTGLILVLAVPDGFIPTDVEITGQYELMSSEGSKSVKVDIKVPVKR